MEVGLLTTEQKDILLNKEFNEGCVFNPIQDMNGNWVISIEEMGMASTEYDWLKGLDLIEYEPKISELTP
jgi:hypothetical protein